MGSVQPGRPGQGAHSECELGLWRSPGAGRRVPSRGWHSWNQQDPAPGRGGARDVASGRRPGDRPLLPPGPRLPTEEFVSGGSDRFGVLQSPRSWWSGRVSVTPRRRNPPALPDRRHGGHRRAQGHRSPGISSRNADQGRCGVGEMPPELWFGHDDSAGRGGFAGGFPTNELHHPDAGGPIRLRPVERQAAQDRSSRHGRRSNGPMLEVTGATLDRAGWLR